MTFGIPQGDRRPRPLPRLPSTYGKKKKRDYHHEKFRENKKAPPVKGGAVECVALVLFFGFGREIVALRGVNV